MVNAEAGTVESTTGRKHPVDFRDINLPLAQWVAHM
jgi:hypothetical protein